MEKKVWSQDILVAILLLAGSGFLLFHAVTTQSAEARQFPMLILVLFMLLALAMLVNGIRDTRRAAAGEDVTIKNVKWEEIKYPMLLFVFITLYIVAVDLIGFVISSLVFTAFLMWYNYARKYVPLVLVPCGLVGFLYVLFTFILKTKMP